MKLVDTIKAFIAKLGEYFTAIKDISKQISDTLNGKEKEVVEEEEEDDDEEVVEEKPKKKKKKK